MKVIHVLPFELFLGGGERFIENWLKYTLHDSVLYALRPRLFTGEAYKIDNCIYYHDYPELIKLLGHHKNDTVVYHSFPEGPVAHLTGFKNLYWYIHGAYAFNRNVSRLPKPRMALSNYKPVRFEKGWNQVFVAGVNLGVDLDQFKPGTKKHDGINIGIIGRIAPEKIPAKWFDYLKQYSPQLNPNIKLSYYGAGDVTSTVYKEFIDKASQFPNFEYCGAVHRDRIHEVYHSFDALLVPSRTETGSYTIVEAQACGLKVFALNVDGIPSHSTSFAELCTDYDDMFRRLISTDFTKVEEWKPLIRKEAESRFCAREQVRNLDFLLTI